MKSRGHAFISYVREDSHDVDMLQQWLEAAGISVWRDTADLGVGKDWRVEIQRATDNAFVFIACFSTRGVARAKSYQNEELLLAIEQLRMRRPGDVWLIPVRFDNCDIPDYQLGGGRTLASIQRADLFGGRRDAEAERLVASVLQLLGQSSSGPGEYQGDPGQDETIVGSPSRRNRSEVAQQVEIKVTRLAKGDGTVLMKAVVTNRSRQPIYNLQIAWFNGTAQEEVSRRVLQIAPGMAKKSEYMVKPPADLDEVKAIAEFEVEGKKWRIHEDGDPWDIFVGPAPSEAYRLFGEDDSLRWSADAPPVSAWADTRTTKNDPARDGKISAYRGPRVVARKWWAALGKRIGPDIRRMAEAAAQMGSFRTWEELADKLGEPVHTVQFWYRSTGYSIGQINAELGTNYELFRWDTSLNKFVVRNEVRAAILNK